MRPPRAAVLAALLAVPATVGVVVVPTASADSATPVTFATPVVVDNFRPGYEPDLAVVTSAAHTPYEGSTLVSVPNGFSTTMSYIWRSDDNRQSFHLVEGNALGKTTTCVGGGDSEMQVDHVNGAVYFADLQGLTNFSNSVSTDAGHTWATTCNAVNGAGVDRQWEAIDSNGGTAAVGPGATGGRLYFDYDNIERNGSGGVGGNQLVMNESADGVHFGSACAGAPTGQPTSACPEPPAIISTNETIPGNVIVDNVPASPFQHRVYAVHTGNGGASVVVSWCSGNPATVARTAATVAAECTDPTLTPRGPNPYWHDTFARAPGSYSVGKLFPSIAIDTTGNLYAVWAEHPSGGAPAAIKLAVSRDGAQTWSDPIVVSTPDLQDVVMPWVVAGDPGRVGVAWYGTSDGRDPRTNKWGPDNADSALWNAYYAVTVNGLDASPAFTQSQINEPGHPVKYGNISTGGLGGTEDRSLGDFFQVQTGPDGQAVVTYVDDTSADRNVDVCGGCGQTPPEAAGPVMVATQNGGPSLYADRLVPGGGTRTGAVSVDPALAAKDAFFSSATQDVAAAANQQLLGASVTQPDDKHLVITLRTADPKLASDLAVSPALGGPVADWMVRWAAPSYDGPGDGNIFYVGMESAGGGAPTFFTGSTQAVTTTHAKYLTYPATATVPGAINGDTITWTVPLAAVGSPATGQGLYSVTGFTTTQPAPSPTSTTATPQGGQAGDANIPNLIAALPPFDATVGQLPGSMVPETAVPVVMVLVAVAAVGLVGWRRRTRAGRPVAGG